MTGFVVFWLSHNSIISFLLVMGVWGWRLWGGRWHCEQNLVEVLVIRYNWCTVTFRKPGHIYHKIDFEVKSVSNTA